MRLCKEVACASRHLLLMPNDDLPDIKCPLRATVHFRQYYQLADTCTGCSAHLQSFVRVTALIRLPSTRSLAEGCVAIHCWCSA